MKVKKMQLLLKIGLIAGIFLSINIWALFQTEEYEFDNIPLLNNIVSLAQKLKHLFITRGEVNSKQYRDVDLDHKNDGNINGKDHQSTHPNTEKQSDNGVNKNKKQTEPTQTTTDDVLQHEIEQESLHVNHHTEQHLPKSGRVISEDSKDSALDSDNSRDRSEINIEQGAHNNVKFISKEESMKIIKLAVVACKDRVDETLIMLKSALMQTKAPLHFHVFADGDNRPKFETALSSWESIKSGSTSYTIHPIQMPEENAEKWVTLWRLCASQRLFFPNLLTDVDSLLYVDTDVLFLRPLDDIWNFFNEFNSTQLAGVAPEHEPKGSRAGWYNRFARHPYYGELGINSGVMLMNLTRMRQVGWVDEIKAHYDKYNLKITWGDQDLINIFFHFHPDRVYVFPCEWNLRPDHCMYGSVCDSADLNGASVLHGNREVFHNEKQPAFKAVYEAFVKYKHGESLESVVTDIKEKWKDTSVSNTPCGRAPKIFQQQLKTQVRIRASLQSTPEKTDDTEKTVSDRINGEPKAAVKSESGEKVAETADPVVENNDLIKNNTEKPKKKRPTVHLAVVACLDRVEETLIMLKSALLQTKTKIKFHIFADDENRPKFQSELSHWPQIVAGRASYKTYPIELPKENQAKWRTLWRPCASQRLFFPKILPKQDALLYVDTDVLFLRPLDDIWKFFNKFNSTQIAALAPEHEPSFTSGWYKRFARHPYYPPMGVNSGVMLMNLTRMREVDWVNKMKEYYTIYKYNITWGDQDLINIFFHYFPEKLLVYPCEWNTRPDHCMYGLQCDSSDKNGASVIHGNREVFHNEKQPAFKAVYTAFRDHPFDGPLEELVSAVKHNLSNETIAGQYCIRASHIFTKQLERQIKIKNKNR